MKLKRRLGFIGGLLETTSRLWGKIIKVIALLAFGVFIYFITQTNLFSVRHIEFTGSDQTNLQLLESIAEKYKGRSIFTINVGKLTREIDSISIYIKNVYVRKELPDRITIQIDERYPQLVLVNLDGVYLLDKDNYVIGTLIESAINVNEDEWTAYKTQNTDIKIVKERITADLKEEYSEELVGLGDEKEEETFIEERYKRVEEERKLEVLEQIRKEVSEATSAHIDQLDLQINESEFAGLQRVYMVENNEYKEGDIIETKRVEITNQVVARLLREDEFTITRLTWESEFSLRVQTQEGKTIVFGTNRSVLDQLEDLDNMLEYLKTNGQNYSSIDLRAKRIAVK